MKYVTYDDEGNERVPLHKAGPSICKKIIL